MDQGRRPNKFIANRNNKIYMDLRDIIREHALPFLPAKSLFRFKGGRTGEQPYYICNPATKQWKKLPKPNANHGSNPALVLIFEPSLLNFIAVYKLICAFPAADFDNAYEFEIYSSSEGSWKISCEIFFGGAMFMPCSGVHVNGIVYWLSKMGGGGIVFFDLTMEHTQRLYSSQNGCLGAMDGKLTVTSAYGQALTVNVLSNSYTNTMGMNSRVKAWDRKLHVNLSDRSELGALPSYTHSAHDQRAVLFASGDVIVFRCDRALHTYDMKTNEFGRLSCEIDHDMRFFGYVNSLVEF